MSGLEADGLAQISGSGTLEVPLLLMTSAPKGEKARVQTAEVAEAVRILVKSFLFKRKSLSNF